MLRKFFSFVITAALATLASCHSANQSTKGSASIVGKNWQLVELNGQGVPPALQSNKSPHLILIASENRVSGNGGCNSFFGSYEIQGESGITFSKMGSTKMACQNSVMDVERQLFQAFEQANGFNLRNDTLLLTKIDTSPLAKFVVNKME